MTFGRGLEWNLQSQWEKGGMEWFEYLRIMFPNFVKNNMMDILPKLGPCTLYNKITRKTLVTKLFNKCSSMYTWLVEWSHLKSNILKGMISNHRKTKLKRKEEPPPINNLFKFEIMWISHPTINEIINGGQKGIQGKYPRFFL